MQAFECMAIGSLPHTDVEQAMALVKANFSAIPFWPQLPRLSENEDMLVQFTQGMPAEESCDDLERLFTDYEELNADNYAVTYSASFEPFIELVKKTKPAYAKGQIVGPFTLAAALTDKDAKAALYDETLREIIVKTLSLKALWQIKRIKEASPSTTPIIFIDEPSISQLGTPAFLTVSGANVEEMFKEISDVIQAAGGLSAIHCCGKCDWSVPIASGVDIISLDAYSYAQNLSLFSKDVQKFLEQGRKIAWGVVPTLDKEALKSANLDKMLKVFEQAVNYLTKKGIDEKMILDNSIITPSCGAGALTEELAQHAMELTRELSARLSIGS